MPSHLGTVDLTQDHIERQSRCSPERALEELIWNALDAGGASVEVRFEVDNMTSVSAVEVRDHGVGIPFSQKDRAFGSIGESVKLNQRTTPEGRALHGSEGRGRFKALVLGTVATWETTYKEHEAFKKYSITVKRSNQRVYSYTDPVPAPGPSGTRVRVEGIDSGTQSLLADATFDGIVVRFAMYLKRYPDVKLRFDNRSVDPTKIIQHSETVALTDPATGAEIGQLEIVEWTFDPDGKKLFICDPDGFAWHEMTTGVHLPGLRVSAYLRWPEAREVYQSNRMALGEMDPAIATVVDAAKEALRQFRKRRLAEQAQTVVEQWKRDKVYPFPDAEPTTTIERAERQVFDIVATRVHEFHEPLRTAESSSKRLTLELVRQALETNPSSLKSIFDKAIRLPKEKQDELAELLELTSFEGIIDAARTVTERMDVICGFESLLFDPDWKRRLRERTQLHRLLVHELWLFGEEYTLDNDDEPWKAYLQKHISKLGRDEPSPDVDPAHINELGKIPDLLLSRRFLRHPRRFENLVIELKRPTIRIGSKEIVQIEEYAGLIISEDAFNKTDYAWTFVLIGNGLDRYAEARASQVHLPPGCISQSGNVAIWVRRWSDIFAEARMRYEFFRERLEVEASAARGLRYLNENYAHLLSGRGMTKKAEIEAGLLTPSTRSGFAPPPSPNTYAADHPADS
ncbi:MAG: ATP-binding protein [Phycisphaerales bacterium]|nr:ATP-binding protein [Phycisphaerales bacterium]